MKIDKLETLARERGYSFERKGREIRWRRNGENRGSVCFSVAEAYDEISHDYEGRLQALNKALNANLPFDWLDGRP